MVLSGHGIRGISATKRAGLNKIWTETLQGGTVVQEPEWPAIMIDEEKGVTLEMAKQLEAEINRKTDAPARRAAAQAAFRSSNPEAARVLSLRPSPARGQRVQPTSAAPQRQRSLIMSSPAAHGARVTRANAGAAREDVRAEDARVQQTFGGASGVACLPSLGLPSELGLPSDPQRLSQVGPPARTGRRLSASF